MTQAIDYQEILRKYKKANQQAKNRILIKWGLTSPGQLEALAVVDTLPKPKSKKKEVVHNVHILDGSSSMKNWNNDKFGSAIKGINLEIEELKKDKNVIYTNTLVVFSSASQIKNIYWKIPIQETKPVLESVYYGGSTALFQAVGNTLETLLNENKQGEKVLVKIFTDGEENNSVEIWRNDGSFTNPRNARLAKLIKDLERKGFTITFVGTAKDVNNIVMNMNIDTTNTLVHDNTAKGVADTFLRSAGATMSYSKDVAAGKDVTRGFYKKVGKL